jgi:hypothetical protein
VRESHELDYLFPDATSAQEAARAWQAATANDRDELGDPLAEVLVLLDSAASLTVDHRDRRVSLDVVLHSDIDVWALDTPSPAPTSKMFWDALEAVASALGGVSCPRERQRQAEVSGTAQPTAPAPTREAPPRKRFDFLPKTPLPKTTWLPLPYRYNTWTPIDPSAREVADQELTSFIEKFRSLGGLKGVNDGSVRRTLARPRNSIECATGVDSVWALIHCVALLDPRFEPGVPFPGEDDHCSWATRVLALSGVQADEIGHETTPIPDDSALEGELLPPIPCHHLDVTCDGQGQRLTVGVSGRAFPESDLVEAINALAQAAGRPADYRVLKMGQDPYASYFLTYLTDEEVQAFEGLGLTPVA